MPVRNRCAHQTTRRQGGMTLIEVLTSMLILSVGVLGMISVQSSAMRFLQSSHSQGDAAMLVNDLADRMRANQAIATSDNAYVHQFGSSIVDDEQEAGQDTGNDTNAKDCASDTCNSAEMAAFDLEQWQEQLARSLPDATAVIARTATAGTDGAKTDDFLITVRWDDDRSGSNGTECDPTKKTAADLDCWQLTVSF